MIFLYHIFYGGVFAYLGLISPGMLNMTALKIRMDVGKNESVKFSIGAAMVVFIQSFIALFFADFFMKKPEIIENLKIAAVFVFFILALLFFVQARKTIKTTHKNKKGNYFFRGLAMSSVNMLSIPFYLGISIYLASAGKIIVEQPYILFFVLGAALGAFMLFYTYINFAGIIAKKISFIAKNINYILSFLFVILGISTMIKLLT